MFGMPQVMLVYAWTEYLALPELVQRVLDLCTTRPRGLILDRHGLLLVFAAGRAGCKPSSLTISP
jgi:hypothetical protein